MENANHLSYQHQTDLLLSASCKNQRSSNLDLCQKATCKKMLYQRDVHFICIIEFF